MGTFDGITVLLVEPHQLVRRIIRDILRGLGVGQVLTVSTPEAAVKFMEDQHIDVVFCDWSGTTDAVALLRLLRAEDSPNPFAPVVLMTAYSDRDHVRIARDLGANEYVLKPFAPQTIVTHLHSVVDHPRRFVRSNVFFGPDRRRHVLEAFPGPERRQGSAYVERRQSQKPYVGTERRTRAATARQLRMP